MAQQVFIHKTCTAVMKISINQFRPLIWVRNYSIKALNFGPQLIGSKLIDKKAPPTKSPRTKATWTKATWTKAPRQKAQKKLRAGFLIFFRIGGP